MQKEGTKLFLKGERCFGAKCAMVEETMRPGSHGQKSAKINRIWTTAREKQKAKVIYGV